MNRPLTWLVVAAAAVAVCFGIGGPLVGRGVFLGTQNLTLTSPWSATVPTGTTVANYCIGDTIDSVLPQREAFLRQLGAGEFGSWDPYVSGGSPLASTPDPALFTPLSLPYYVLPAWLAPAWSEFGVMVVAIGGMYLFLRRLTLSPPAGVLGGVVFATSGFMLSWINWPQVEVAAFIPLLFWAIDRLAVQRRAVDAVPVALVVAAMLLGGFPAVTGWALYAAAPYLLLRLWVARPRDATGLLGGAALGGLGVGLGVALVGVQLLPFLDSLGATSLAYRGQVPTEHLPLVDLTTALVPSALQGQCTGSWWPAPVNLIEGLSYLGGAALVLVALALFRRPAPGVPKGVRGYLVVGLALVVVLTYLGGGPLGVAQHLPVFSNNYVGRLRSLLGFFAAALAGFGFDRALRPAARRRVPGLLAEGAGWVLAAVAAGFVVHRLFVIGEQYHHPADAHRAVIWPLAGAAIAFVAVIAAGLLRGRPRALLLAVVPVVVVAQALTVMRPLLPRSPRSEFYPVTGTQRYLAAHLGDGRFATIGTAAEPGTSSYYGLRAANGHTFTESGWQQLLLGVNPKTFLTPTYSTLPGTVTAAQLRSPLLDLMAVDYVVADPGGPLFGTPVSVGGSGGVTTLRAGQTASFPVAAAAIRGAGPVLAAPATGHGYAGVRVRLVDAAGRVLASDTRRLPAVTPAGPFLVPLAAEDAGAAAGPLTAQVSLTGGAGPLRLVSGTGGLGGVVMTDPGDGLRLTYAADTVIYQRASAYPAFRWASTSTVLGTPAARLALLAGTRDPSRVVLNRAAPPGCGRPGTVRVRQDAAEAITLDVQAAGCGYVVVSAALQDSGWHATVDGAPARLRAADEGLVAVRVPAGRHVVRLADSHVRMRRGMLGTAAAAVVLAALYVDFRRRRRRTREA